MRAARLSRVLLFVVLGSCAGIGLPAGVARAAVDAREMQAREDFAAGRYQEALDLFAKLYAEKLHPNYLRNIGRCYQNLGEPARAISSFREYLRKAKKMTQAERVEIEGYITEMEQLRKSQETPAQAPMRPAPPVTGGGPSSAPSAATAQAPGAAPPATRTVALDRDARDARAVGASGTTANPALTLKAAPPAPTTRDESSPVYARWWFWATVGGVVVAGVAGAAVAGVFTVKDDAPCPMGGCK